MRGGTRPQGRREGSKQRRKGLVSLIRPATCSFRRHPTPGMSTGKSLSSVQTWTCLWSPHSGQESHTLFSQAKPRSAPHSVAFETGDAGLTGDTGLTGLTAAAAASAAKTAREDIWGERGTTPWDPNRLSHAVAACAQRHNKAGQCLMRSSVDAVLRRGDHMSTVSPPMAPN